MSERKMYFGPAEIIMVKEMPYKTPDGGDVVKVILDRKVQPYEILPKKSFEKLCSFEPIEDTLFRENRYKPVLEKLAEVLLNEGVIYADEAYVCKALHEKLNTSFEKATHFLWTKGEEEFIPGIHELSNRSLLEADVILKQIKNEPSPEQKSV